MSMSGVKKRDRDIDFIAALKDKENPNREKSQKSTNYLFLICAAAILIAAGILTQEYVSNARLEHDIQECRDYINDPVNIKTEKWHVLLGQRKAILDTYTEKGKKFLEELQNTHRYSQEEFQFYQDSLRTVTGDNNSYISTFLADFNTINITCMVADETMPKIYAEYLTNLKDENGDPQYALVTYSGFSSTERGTQFKIVLTTWNKPKSN